MKVVFSSSVSSSVEERSYVVLYNRLVQKTAAQLTHCARASVRLTNV